MPKQTFQLSIPAEDAMEYSPEMLKNYALNLVADEFEKLGLIEPNCVESPFDFDMEIKPTSDYKAMQVTVTFDT